MIGDFVGERTWWLFIDPIASNSHLKHTRPVNQTWPTERENPKQTPSCAGSCSFLQSVEAQHFPPCRKHRSQKCCDCALRPWPYIMAWLLVLDLLVWVFLETANIFVHSSLLRKVTTITSNLIGTSKLTNHQSLHMDEDHISSNHVSQEQKSKHAVSTSSFTLDS